MLSAQRRSNGAHRLRDSTKGLLTDADVVQDAPTTHRNSLLVRKPLSRPRHKTRMLKFVLTMNSILHRFYEITFGMATFASLNTFHDRFHDRSIGEDPQEFAVFFVGGGDYPFAE